jgi:hypothetical protein
MRLEVMEIAQVPGLRRHSRNPKSISESLATTGWAIPIVVVNPYLAGGILADYLIRGRFHPVPKNPPKLGPQSLFALTETQPKLENAEYPDAGTQTAGSTQPSSSTAGLGFEVQPSDHE